MLLSGKLYSGIPTERVARGMSAIAEEKEEKWRKRRVVDDLHPFAEISHSFRLKIKKIAHLFVRTCDWPLETV